jgi:CTP:molybdopterin cytidylyltransferase MocA
MKPPSVVAIILAAGFSSRMRQFKPLLPLGSKTITEHLISVYLRNSVDVILVVGHRQNELLSRIEEKHITIASNHCYQEGMLSSIQAGVRRLKAEHTHFFVSPVDTPLIRPSTVQRLLEAASASPNRIIFPVFEGKRGHPPLLPVDLAPSIMNWTGEGGLAALLRSQRNRHLEIEVQDSGILLDVDTPGDYQELVKRFGEPR